LIFIAVVVVAITCPAASAGLAGAIDGIISSSSQRGVDYGICVAEADSGTILYQHNSHKAMLPASNMKIVTTAAALEYLGADFEYVTRVGLAGDAVAVIGSGDPLLGDEAMNLTHRRGDGWVLRDIAGRLKSRGVERVVDVLVDTTVFDDERVHPSWPADQLNRWYACEVSGVNYKGNCVDITAVRVGASVELRLEPDTDYLEIENDVDVINSGTGAVGSYRNGEANNIIVYGKCRERQGPFSVAIERPGAFFGFLLYEELKANGIEVGGQLVVREIDKSKFEPIAEYRTPLSDCLKRCNKDSFGLAAEALMKTIAARSGDKEREGSWARGRELMSDYLAGLGIERGEFYIDDGSGLSRKNRLSGYCLASVLMDMYKRDYWGMYRDSLATGGVDGTVGKYFDQEKYRGRILGKSGYISGVKSLSGVCLTDGGVYVFSVLANGANGRTRGAINDIAKAVFDYGQGDG